jgi:hypothetical protein
VGRLLFESEQQVNLFRIWPVWTEEPGNYVAAEPGGPLQWRTTVLTKWAIEEVRIAHEILNRGD